VTFSWRPASAGLVLCLAVSIIARAPGPVQASVAAPIEGCTGDQTAALEDAIIAARALAGSAATYLEGVSMEQRRFDAPYETWFGAYDAWRYGHVIANYRAIEATLAPASTRFRCGCPSTAAGLQIEVEQGVAPVISVCEGFWLAPPSGGRSRAGALIEAASRLSGSGGAEPLAVTQIQSTTLAGQRPADAIRNAAAYRFFAEEEKDAGVEHLPAALALVLLILLAEGYRRTRAGA